MNYGQGAHADNPVCHHAAMWPAGHKSAMNCRHPTGIQSEETEDSGLDNRSFYVSHL